MSQLQLFDPAPFTRECCLDCGVDTVAIGEYYMLRGEIWALVADRDAGMLCIGCVEARLGRRLKPGDFKKDFPIDRSPRLRARALGLDRRRPNPGGSSRGTPAVNDSSR